MNSNITNRLHNNSIVNNDHAIASEHHHNNTASNNIDIVAARDTNQQTNRNAISRYSHIENTNKLVRILILIDNHST